MRVHAEVSMRPRPTATSTDKSKAFPGSHSRPSGKGGAKPGCPIFWLGASARTLRGPRICKINLQGAQVSVTELLISSADKGVRPSHHG